MKSVQSTTRNDLKDCTGAHESGGAGWVGLGKESELLAARVACSSNLRNTQLRRYAALLLTHDRPTIEHLCCTSEPS
jgi:hypothetical protein